MIDVRYKARLGNNLFQYCFGRILAEALGFELHAAPIDGLPNTREAVCGLRHGEPEVVLTGQRVDLDAVLGDHRPRKIVLDGWFQRYEYYRPHRDRIRRWLQFGPDVAAPRRVPDTVLHIRRTDYVQLGWALPFSFYDQALERVPAAGDLWILTDDPKDPFFRRFDRWRPTFATGTPLEDLRLLMSARNIVMSQSTFSWWAAFLGDPQMVVCPDPLFGAWAPGGDAPEAMLIERDRFVCLPCAAPDQPSPVEARYQSRRLFRRRVILAVNRRLGTTLMVPPH